MDLLGCDVVGRALDALLDRAGLAALAEVDQLQAALLGEQDVVGLDVGVDEAR